MATLQTARSAPPPAVDRRDVDWRAIEGSPEFRELVTRRRRFIVPATAFFLIWYFGFVVLAGYAPDFMGESIYQGFTVGYALAMTQFVMVWGLTWLYLRESDRVFDPLAARAARTALELNRTGAAPPDARPAAQPAGEVQQR